MSHYSIPYVPFIPSLWTWPEQRMIHSCAYRRPTDPIFDQKTVAVIGIGPSGYDILRELAMLRERQEEEAKNRASDDDSQERRRARPASKKLYSLSSHPSKLGWDFKDPNAPSWAKSITSVARLKSIEGDQLHLVEGRVLDDVDLVCFATGYLYHFPFCQERPSPWKDHPLTRPPPTPTTSDPTPGTSTLTHPHSHRNHRHFIGGLRVHNLDQNQIFYYPDPSPGCLVLNTQVAPFPLSILEERFPIQPMENEDEESREVHALAPVSSR